MIHYRPAEKHDSPALANFINTASDGVVGHLFHNLIPGLTAVQVVCHDLENDHQPHSCKNAIVAVDGDTVVGAALSYSSSCHEITGQTRQFIPADRLAHLEDFYASRVEIPGSLMPCVLTKICTAGVSASN